MAAYRRVYDMLVCVCRCGPGGRWWQPTTHRVHDYACCHLQAVRDQLRPLTLDIHEYGYLYLYFTVACSTLVFLQIELAYIICC